MEIDIWHVIAALCVGLALGFIIGLVCKGS
jgi:hypothetical protein